MYTLTNQGRASLKKKKEKNKVQESRHEVTREGTRVVTLLSLHRRER